MDLANLNLKPWILPAATALGAWGGFPKPPKMFSNLAQNEIVQYLLVFVLVWQGGSGQNIRVAAIVALAMFVLVKALEMLKL